MSIGLDEALDLTRTGDVWLFRGRSMPDRAIQITTNSPINHVGMSVVLDDLPPLMWHAELGRSLLDVWSGEHHRGVQLHDLRQAVLVWANRYGQRAWLRQLDQPPTKQMEDAVLRTIARLDGTPFPSTARMAGRWLGGRIPTLRWRGHSSNGGLGNGGSGNGASGNGGSGSGASGSGWSGNGKANGEANLETAYCAEVVAVTYEAMGLLPSGRRVNWYDPGRFWSGDDLEMTTGFSLGGEIAVQIPL
jgi:hypothetical protein